MVDSHMMHENSIKQQGQLQNDKNNTKQALELKIMAGMMKYDYAKKMTQSDFQLPILDVRDDGFDSGTFLEASGTQQDGFLALKSLGIVFSVFEFS